MRRLSGILFAIACLGLGTYGCGGGNSKDMGGGGSLDLSMPGGDNPDLAMAKMTVDQACTSLATAACNRLNMCSAYFLELVYGDMDTCIARNKISCTLSAGSMVTGTSTTADTISACASAYGGVACTDIVYLPAFFGGFFNPAGVPACRVMAGMLNDGMACGEASQCKNSYCRGGQGADPFCGTCVKPAPIGAACGAMTPCEVGLFCISNKCAKFGAAGDACGAAADGPCGSGLYCKTGKCAAQLTAGTACNPMAFGPECDNLAGLYCPSATKKCTAYKLAKTGDACAPVNGITVLCNESGACRGMGANMKCEGPAADGAACDFVAGPGCLFPAVCVNKTCTIHDPAVCK